MKFEMDHENRVIRVNGVLVKLSRKPYWLVYSLWLAKSVKSNGELQTEVWPGHHFERGNKLLEVTIHRVNVTCERATGHRLINNRYGFGYVLAPYDVTLTPDGVTPVLDHHQSMLVQESCG